MTKPASVSFIGAGNLAWHLAPALDNAGYVVKEVYSRDARNAESLVEKLYEAEVKTDLDFSTSASSVFIIAVPDDVIPEIAQEIALPGDAILVHTSGSQAVSVLGYAATPNLGVFYPLQTFTMNTKVELRIVDDAMLKARTPPPLKAALLATSSALISEKVVATA